MRVVVALGGNALLRRGEAMSAQTQRRNARLAAAALAPIASEHELVISHGNGPQVGLLALQAAAGKPEEAYPLDVLDAETEGGIGYLIEQELHNTLPVGMPIATLLTMVEVDPSDPGFENPTKFVGPIYQEGEAARIAHERGWVVKQDGAGWRRVVPSPLPRRILEMRPIKWLLERGVVVVCAGGGGIPTAYASGRGRRLVGVEAVIDKDLCSELLARELDADLLIMATDVEAVFTGWGTPNARAISRASPAAMGRLQFPPGSMGPKVGAARRFATATGKVAAIGAIAELPAITRGVAGTLVSTAFEGIAYRP
jgi:carbamate kinase